MVFASGGDRAVTTNSSGCELMPRSLYVNHGSKNANPYFSVYGMFTLCVIALVLVYE